MLDSLRNNTGRGLSRVGAAAMYVIMLPFTIAALLIMTVAGALALLNLRHRRREVEASSRWQSSENAQDSVGDGSLRQPIEGSYTVIRD